MSDEPLMILKTALDAMYEDCATCGGRGTTESHTRTVRAVKPEDDISDLPENLRALAEEILAKRPGGIAKLVMGHTSTHTCCNCGGTGRTLTPEGALLLDLLATMLAPFLGQHFARYYHEHTMS
jgi:hypothetical protein